MKIMSKSKREKLAKAIAELPYYTVKDSTQLGYIKRIEKLLKEWGL